ncbi:hypothetical protein [Saccharicrinis sp. 156]|uniref:hypothetical protein n=1 Tax=Saccharicrinis sp. 156 TaxID=3417574 RepID=UPI003D350D75
MKAYKQTFEIIDYARLFHKKLNDFYEQLHEKSEKQRVKMLLEYLSKHEKHREETLANYEKEASEKVMDTWFKYVPGNISSECLEKMVIKPDMSVDEVVDSALLMNNCLIKLYKGLIEETKIDEVKEVFISLLKRIEKEERDLVRDATRLKDI